MKPKLIKETSKLTVVYGPDYSVPLTAGVIIFCTFYFNPPGSFSLLDPVIVDTVICLAVIIWSWLNIRQETNIFDKIGGYFIWSKKRLLNTKHGKIPLSQIRNVVVEKYEYTENLIYWMLTYRSLQTRSHVSLYTDTDSFRLSSSCTYSYDLSSQRVLVKEIKSFIGLSNDKEPEVVTISASTNK